MAGSVLGCVWTSLTEDVAATAARHVTVNKASLLWGRPGAEPLGSKGRVGTKRERQG